VTPPWITRGEFSPLPDDRLHQPQKSFEVLGCFHRTADKFPSAEALVIERIREVIGVSLRNSLGTQDSSSGRDESDAPAN
jgi:hypothetical protein